MSGQVDYEVKILLSRKWENTVGYQLTWKEIVICELLSDPMNASEYTPTTTGANESPINAFTTIIELSDLTGEFDRLYDEIENPETGRRKLSPDWSEGQKLFEEELKNELEIREFPVEYNPSLVEWIAEPFIRERVALKQRVFRDLMAGKNSQIIDYAEYLYRYREKFYADFFQTLLGDISRAAAIAQIMRILKDSNSNGELNNGANQAKLKWSGDPREFVSILKILIDKGYIDNCKTATQLAAIALSSFNITSNRNGPASKKILLNYLSSGIQGLDREFESLYRHFPFSSSCGRK